MKKIILILLLLSAQKAFACSCLPAPFMERVSMSDFIATAKILKISPDDENSGLHNIEIEIINLYKGHPTKKMKIYSMLDSSCAFYTPEGSEWLILATKNEKGDLSFGYCSYIERLDRKFDSEEYPEAEKNYKKSIDRKLQVLAYLKKSKIQVSNKFEIKSHFINRCLDNFKGYEVKKDRFALYEITVESDLSISRVRVLKKFDNKDLKADLLNCVKSVRVYTRKKILSKSKIVIGLYHYTINNSNDNFISQIY